MNELEDRLRTSLERDASKVPLITAAPGGLRRRVRRRQGLVGAAAGGTALVVVFACDAPPAPAPAEWSGRLVCPLWLFNRSGTATLRFYDGSGGGSQQDWPQSHPPMQLTWGWARFRCGHERCHEGFGGR